jgi:hypothetical protein
MLYLFVALVVLSLPAHITGTDSNIQTKEADLIQKYVVLCEQNASDRLLSIQTLNPTEKAYLWRLHLGLYLTRNPSFSRDQQSIVLETLTLIAPKLFNPPDPNKLNERSKTLEQVDQLKRRGLQIFSKDEAAELFSAIGGPQDGEAVRKYTQLSELSRGDRKASFNLMGAEDKATMWRVHFGINLARHPEWTDQQLAVVLEAIAMVRPELYKIPKDAKWASLVDEPARVLAQKALIVFSKTEGAALFSELGFAEQAKSNHRRPTEHCSCSSESDWCARQCLSTECTVMTWGCGTLGLYACNGTCGGSPNGN